MFVRHLEARNWRNFRRIDVSLRERQFIIGPNASGKSNLLDIFRFLRDIATAEGGGLQKAVKQRGGVSKLRSLAARRDPEILIALTLSETPDGPLTWSYELSFTQESRGKRNTVVKSEKVSRDGRTILERPNHEDETDAQRLTQTALEQINANQDFRDIAYFLQNITYLHLVPQLLRFVDSIQGRVLENDPFGQGFLERIAKTPEKTRRVRLKRMEDALKIAVPKLKELEFVRDQDTGRPHLQALYSHWRPNAGFQQEDQFSDGTLRLIGLLWSLQEGDSLLLLEEPELSLNAGIVVHLASLVARVQRARRRQVLISTHSDALLSDPGIDGKEVLLLTPGSEGTEAAVASDLTEVRALLEAGLTAADAILPRTRPEHANHLSSVE
jgi:predicted ATPase